MRTGEDAQQAGAPRGSRTHGTRAEVAHLVLTTHPGGHAAAGSTSGTTAWATPRARRWRGRPVAWWGVDTQWAG